MVLAQGSKAPEFSTTNQAGATITLQDVLQKYNSIVLFFYPKDNTPGCTVEAKTFAEMHSQFVNLNVGIFGVSADSEKSHASFCSKYNLPYDLLVDKSMAIIKQYGVVSNTGKSAQRVTFLIGKDGNVVHVVQGVKTKDIPSECLQLLNAGDTKQEATDAKDDEEQEETKEEGTKTRKRKAASTKTSKKPTKRAKK